MTFKLSRVSIHGMKTNEAIELLNVIDLNDNIIGQASRAECHQNPQLLNHTVHFTLIIKTISEIS